MNYDTIEYKGFEIEIIYDECPANPRTEWDNLCTIAYYSRQYIKGDEGHCFNNRYDMLFSIADLNYNQEEWYNETCNYSNKFDPEKYLINQIAKHSFYIDNGDQFIYVSKDAIRKEWKVKRINANLKKIVNSNMVGELSTLEAWANGEVFGFDIETINDSCWGFYGTDLEYNGLMDYARSAIDEYIREEIKKANQAKQNHFNQIKSWIRSKVQLQYRNSYTPYV